MLPVCTREKYARNAARPNLKITAPHWCQLGERAERVAGNFRLSDLLVWRDIWTIWRVTDPTRGTVERRQGAGGTRVENGCFIYTSCVERTQVLLGLVEMFWDITLHKTKIYHLARRLVCR